MADIDELNILIKSLTLLGVVHLSCDTRRGVGDLKIVNFVSLSPLRVIQGGGRGSTMVNFVSHDM